MVKVRYSGTPLRLTISESHTVELPSQLVRFRMKGMMFDTDKTFLLPRAIRGMRRLVEVFDQRQAPSLVITGHGDRVGGADYNLGLSTERAEALAHFLRDEATDWLRWYDDQPYSRPWGALEDQHMLATILDAQTGIPFYDAGVDGIFGTVSREAARRFQAARGLSVDGIPGPQTREALITDYMAQDGTSLPAEADVQLLGCGEHHNAIPTDDGVDEPGNRRVEVFLFDPGPPTPPPPSSCPGEGCPYETWLANTVRTVDFDHDLPEANWDVFSFEVAIADADPMHDELEAGLDTAS